MVIAGSLEDVSQVSQRIDATALAGADDRVDDRGAIAGIGMADEEEVLFPYRRWPDGIFHQVVVEPGAAVLAVGDQGVPLVDQVVARFPKRRP